MNRILFLLPVMMLCVSCASIVDGGSEKTVQVSSNPPGAKVTITDKKGATVQVVETPARVSLKRNRSPYVAERYNLRFVAPGYHPSEATVRSTMNGWYLGNVVFGGLLGIVIVDPVTGAMFTLAPKEIHRDLIPLSTPLTSAELAKANARANPAPLKRQTASVKLR